jgi:uncharacterized membrane protein (DUF2068 family)
MDRHVTAVAALHIGLSALGLLLGMFLFFVLGTIAAISHDPDALVILPTIGTLVGGGLMALSAIGIVGGVGLLSHKNWARILILVLSVFDAFNIPVGTVIAVYSFWVLVQDETVRLFSPSGVPAAPKTSAP